MCPRNKNKFDSQTMKKRDILHITQLIYFFIKLIPTNQKYYDSKLSVSILF
ncbi:hypothetical protein Hanom_Chr14g01301271 [Helianthus anomalus]